MSLGQGADAAFDGFYELRRAVGLGEADDGLNNGKRIARPMIDLAGKQRLAFLCLFALGDIDRHTVHSREPVIVTECPGSGHDAPA